MNSPHYFIAVPLPGFLKEQLAGWQRALKAELSYKQWVHPADLHITLKFLGAVERHQLETLMKSMQQIERLSVFSLITGALGTFGNPKKPRVLWVEVEQKRELIHLQEHIEDIARQEGFQQENRAYLPHITLAKKWSGGTKDLRELKKRYRNQQMFTVHQVVLYRIYPGRNPKYATVARYYLGGGN